MFGRPTKTKVEKPLCSNPMRNGFNAGSEMVSSEMVSSEMGSCPSSNQTNLGSLLSWLGAEKPTGYDNIYALELVRPKNLLLVDKPSKGSETRVGTACILP